jgi:hypothetical protein
MAEKWLEERARYRTIGERATLVIAVTMPVILLFSHTRNLFVWAFAIWFLCAAVTTNLRRRAYDQHMKRNPHLQANKEDILSIGELRAAIDREIRKRIEQGELFTSESIARAVATNEAALVKRNSEHLVGTVIEPLVAETIAQLRASGDGGK